MAQAARSRPSASATRSWAWCRSSTRCAATSWASTATGARPRRTSPTPPPCCRSARRWRWSTPNSPAISAALARLAREHRDTPMIGRSNLQQAIPVTFGYKMAGILCGDRAPPRAPGAAARRACWWASSRGAAGTLASLEKGAMETQAGLCAELGLRPAGDRLAHHPRQHRRGRRASSAWSAARWASSSMDVKLMMQTEVGEVYEPYAPRPRLAAAPCRRSATRSRSCYIHAAISRRAPARRRADGRDGGRPRALAPARGRSNGSCCPRPSA